MHIYKVYKHDDRVNSVAISDALLASASNDKNVCVWDMKTKKELYRLKHYAAVFCVSFHNDLIISACTGKFTRIWKKSTGKHVHPLVHKGQNSNFDVSPNGALIAVAHNSGVSIWSLENFERIGEVELDRVQDVRFQTNGKIIAALHDGQVYLIKTN